jgi:V8-like Glu-specific endopeptidase
MPSVKRLLEQYPHISKSVGNLRIRLDDKYYWVGTAFVIESGLVVTNAHVGDYFSTFDEHVREWQIYPDTLVEFVTGVEYEGCQPTRFEDKAHQVTKVLTAGKGKGKDYALLKVDSLAAPPLTLADQPIMAGETVVVLGYPAEPTFEQIDSSRFTVEETRQRLFLTPDNRTPFSVKRISPGRSMNSDTGGEGVPFNYNSFGGNSGSPVIRLSDGKVVALHFGGTPQLAAGIGYNIGMPAHELRKLLDNVKM